MCVTPKLSVFLIKFVTRNNEKVDNLRLFSIYLKIKWCKERKKEKKKEYPGTMAIKI